LFVSTCFNVCNQRNEPNEPVRVERFRMLGKRLGMAQARAEAEAPVFEATDFNRFQQLLNHGYPGVSKCCPTAQLT